MFTSQVTQAAEGRGFKFKQASRRRRRSSSHRTTEGLLCNLQGVQRTTTTVSEAIKVRYNADIKKLEVQLQLLQN